MDWNLPRTPETIFGHRAVRNRVTRELTIFGRFGEVWEKGDGVHVKLLLYPETRPQKRKEIAAAAGVPYTAVRSILVVESHRLSAVLAVLRVPVRPGRQLFLYRRAYGVAATKRLPISVAA